MKLYIIFIALSFSLFFSCNQTLPNLVSTQSSVIFEYNDDISLPRMKLAVFAESESDVRRAKNIHIISNANKYEWTTDDVQMLEYDSRKYAFYSNFVCPDVETIPEGYYDIFFTDELGEVSESKFFVSYPESIANAKANEVKEMLGENVKERIAIYDSKDILIFFDERRENWNDLNTIWQEVDNAEKFRVCFSNADDSVMCFMPIKEKSQNKISEE